MTAPGDTTERALVLGCGYFGLRAARILAAEGVHVTATTTRAERAVELAAEGLEPALLDLTRPGESAALTSRPDLVICAVAPARDADPRVVFRDGPLAAARILLERGLDPRRFVFTSSTGVYPQKDGSELDEETAADPEDSRHSILRQAENRLLQLGAVVLRLGGLYGPGRSPLEWLRRPEIRERILAGCADAWMNWVRVEDAAQAAVLALRRGSRGRLFIVVDDAPVRRRDFYRHAAAVAGLPEPCFAGGSGDLGKRCSNRRAREELGFRPQFPTYREGLDGLQRL
jgi:nucleoside-diphosphate-sugar epimerase